MRLANHCRLGRLLGALTAVMDYFGIWREVNPPTQLFGPIAPIDLIEKDRKVGIKFPDLQIGIAAYHQKRAHWLIRFDLRLIIEPAQKITPQPFVLRENPCQASDFVKQR